MSGAASFEEIKKHLWNDLHLEVNDEDLARMLDELAKDGLIEEVKKDE